MQTKNLLNVILVLLIVGGSFACKMPVGKKKAIATGDNFEPNTICSLVNDMNFDTDEYKEFTATLIFAPAPTRTKFSTTLPAIPLLLDKSKSLCFPKQSRKPSEKTPKQSFRRRA